MGTGEGQFNYPQGIAVDTLGNVYVVDAFNHRAQVFSSDGTFLGEWGGPGIGEGQFYYPQGIAVDTLGNVYVADAFNHRVQVLSSDGMFLREWGGLGIGEGQFNYPQGISVDTIVNLFSNVPDFKEEKTRYQVEHLSGIRIGKEPYMPYNCSSLQTHSVCSRPNDPIPTRDAACP